MSTSVVTVQFSPTAQARASHAAATGVILDSVVERRLDLGDFSAEQRARFLALLGLPNNDAKYLLCNPVPGVFRSGDAYIHPSVPQEPAGFLALAEAFAAHRDQVLARVAAEDAARELRREQERREQLARHLTSLDKLEAMGDDDLAALGGERVIPLPMDLPDEVRARTERIRARAKELAAAREVAEAETAAQARAERRAVRAAWIAAHGSAYLKRAVGAGYNCQRRYVSERAALELPGFRVDFDREADWSDRSCPSEERLERALALAQAGHAAEVVWLTREPGDPAERWDPDEPREAVVITGYLGRYQLIEE